MGAAWRPHLATVDAPLSVPPLSQTYTHPHSWCYPGSLRHLIPFAQPEAENSGEAGKPQAPDLDWPTSAPSKEQLGFETVC